MRTVLLAGAGRAQLPAIARAKEAGLRVVAADHDPEAPGLAAADIARVVDFSDPAALVASAARLRLDGALTTALDGRAVVAAAALAEARGLPGIGTETAHLLTNKIALRRRLAETGVPQPRFAALRSLPERRRAVAEVGLPAVLKPADAGGQRSVFRIDSLDDVEAHLHETLATSRSGEAILEELVDGVELTAIVVARNGQTVPVALFDRLRSVVAGFGVGFAQVYPSSLQADRAVEAERIARDAVHAVRLGNGIARPQLIATPDGRLVVAACGAGAPSGRISELVRLATGVELVDVQLAAALGDELTDRLVRPRHSQPLAIRHLTAEPGPLPVGRVVHVGPLDKVLAFPGVTDAAAYLEPGDTIGPLRTPADRRGYVIATGATSLEALERAEAAAGLLDVEVADEP